MADRAKPKPRHLVEPVSLVDVNLWDMFQAAAEAGDQSALPEQESGKDAPGLREEAAEQVKAAERKRAAAARRRKRPDQRGTTAEE